jgi:nucleotide-binding universal stress UspA family protein
MDNRSPEVILVPVDFTDVAFNALTVAVRLAQQLSLGVHLVHVLEPELTGAGLAAGLVPDRIRAQLVQEGTGRLQALAAQMTQQHQVVCSGSHRVGEPVEEIVALGRETNARLIVMGVRPGGDLLAHRQNTIAYQLVRTADSPVLTVPAGQAWPSFRRILFPVRPVPLDKYEFSRSLIRDSQAELTVLALFNPDEIISRRQLNDEIALLDEKLAQDGIRYQTIFQATELAAEAVLAKAMALGSDLMIITAALNTSPTNFFVGPFTRQVIYNAPLPVLAIRPESTLPTPMGRVAWRYGQIDLGLSALGL